MREMDPVWEREGEAELGSCDPVFQHLDAVELPPLRDVRSVGGVGLMTRLLAGSVLSMAALAGCGSSGEANCPTPTPQIPAPRPPAAQKVTCTSSNGTHFVYIPGRGWSSTGRGSGVGSSGHSGSGS